MPKAVNSNTHSKRNKLTYRFLHFFLNHSNLSTEQLSYLLKEILFKMGIGVSSDHSKNGELKLIHYIKNNVSEKPIIFDVGANIGTYSKLLSSEFPKATIYAFEPLIGTFEQLMKTNTSNNIKTFNLGLSDAISEKTIYHNDNSLLSSLYERDIRHTSSTLNKSSTINLTTLDIFCKQNNIQSIDFLKIDVEGHEYNVFKGASEMISNGAIQFIQFEFGGCNIDAKIFFKDLYYLLIENYTLYRIHENGFTLLSNYSETLEQFNTTNYFAQLRRK